MDTTIIIGEALLYLSYALLFGFIVINLIPVTKRPLINFPKWLRLSCVIGLAIFSFPPIFKLVLFLAGDMGLLWTLKSVLTNFESGKVWSLTAALAVFLLILNIVPEYEQKKSLMIISLFCMLGFAVLEGRSSHSGTLIGWYGVMIHSGHFLAIAVWSGILLLIGWFSKDKSDWLQTFLSWFTPLAIICVVIAIGTGFSMMQLVIKLKDYSQSWLLPYGQAILIKHLLIFPILVFAVINGFLLKRMMKKSGDIKVFSWLKAEGVFVLFIFIVTAILGTLSPPHFIAETIESEGPSKLMESIYPGRILPEMVVNIRFQGPSMVLAILAAGCLLMMVYLFLQKKRSIFAVMAGSFFVVLSYFSLMLSV